MRLLCLLCLIIISILFSKSQPNGDADEELCEDEPPEKRLRSSCYFSVPRSSTLEIIPRADKFKVSTQCDGPLHSMSELARNYDGKMFGAPNRLGFLLATGEGTFIDDWTDISRWEEEGICEKHLAELSRHVSRSSYKIEEGSKCAKCAYPTDKPHSAKAQRTMSYQKSHNLLLAKNILVPPGTPLCANHYNGIPKAATSSTTALPPHDAIPDSEPAANPWAVKDFTYAQGPIPGGYSAGDGMDVDDEDSDASSSVGDDEESDASCSEGDDEDPRKSFFKQFLKASNIKRAFCNKNYKNLAEKTQKDKLRTLRKILREIIGIVVCE